MIGTWNSRGASADREIPRVWTVPDMSLWGFHYLGAKKIRASELSHLFALLVCQLNH